MGRLHRKSFPGSSGGAGGKTVKRVVFEKGQAKKIHPFEPSLEGSNSPYFGRRDSGEVRG